jgi:hypothetical protein
VPDKDVMLRLLLRLESCLAVGTPLPRATVELIGRHATAGFQS